MEVYKKFLDPKSETALSLDGTKHEVNSVWNLLNELY